jgi:hypothetical protein
LYLRALLTHGARSVLFNAYRRSRAHADRLSPIQRWVLSVAARRGHNKAVSALANKLARVIWAVWHRDVHAGRRVGTGQSGGERNLPHSVHRRRSTIMAQPVRPAPNQVEKCRLADDRSEP